MRAVALLAVLAGSVCAEPKIEPVAGQQSVIIDYDKATDFSGITWMGGENFMTVSNKDVALYPLKLRIEPQTGRVVESKFGARISVKSKLNDFEGIAFLAEKNRIYVSAEGGNGIVGFDLAGEATFAVEVPKVFSRARQNKSLESLTSGAGALWTANEEALNGDGSVSGQTAGTVVRLQKFDAKFQPVEQFAYRTDTCALNGSGGRTGVSDLLALPDGGLLALERVVTSLGLKAKIYRVDFSGATDTSSIEKLEGAQFTPVKKKLLYEQLTFVTNYEGITLGPVLAGGWRSLLLIADSGGGTKHSLLPLRIFLDAK